MHVSARTLYALRTIVQLASDPDNPTYHARELSDQRYIDEDYIVQVLARLREAGIVASKKGPRGGYRLSRPPDDITLKDVVLAMEGPTLVSPCTQPEYSDCEIVDRCSTQSVLSAVAAGIEELLDEITVEDIRQEAVHPPETQLLGSPSSTSPSDDPV